jgi:hypothetical protein
MMSDEQNPVAWMVRDGVVDYQLVKRKEQADHLVAELQKRHDLSGALAAFNAVALYTHHNPAVVKQLVEAAESALEAMQSVAWEAYQRAEPVCCGRGGNECCGCPEPKWNSVDEVTMLRLHRPQQELTAALAAARGEGW